MIQLRAHLDASAEYYMILTPTESLIAFLCKKNFYNLFAFSSYKQQPNVCICVPNVFRKTILD